VPAVPTPALAVFAAGALRQLVAAPPPAAAAPVLVVEHDAATRRVLAQVLRAEGFAVATAADGSQALTTLARQRPAAVLLDLGLPDMAGARVAADVQARYADAVPIIVVAGGRPVAADRNDLGLGGHDEFRRSVAVGSVSAKPK
jgi:DNA-binding response OmpR family regulator